MTSVNIQQIVIDALAGRKSGLAAKEIGKSASQTCKDAIGHGFEQILGSNVDVDATIKAAHKSVFGEDCPKATVSELGLIARAGLAGQYTNACKAADDYAAACEASDLSSGPRERNIFNLLRDREDHGTACTLEGMYASVARRFAPAKSALRTWLATSETLVTLLAEAGFTLTLGTVEVEKIVKEAFPDQFKSTGKAKRKGLPVLVVDNTVQGQPAADFIPPAPSAPLPTPVPVEVSPASASMPTFDIGALLGSISQLSDAVKSQGAQLAALATKRNKK